MDWEQFTGVKLFAWLGGLALFIAAGFFVKFSIDRNLIPPTVRLAIVAMAGIALVVWSGRFRQPRYAITRQTLAAGGIGVLYSVVFAATLYYGYIGKPVGFGLLTIISAAAFVLAVQYRGVMISILGAVGAYATPFLVGMGQQSLPLLLAYLSVVNLGLYQVAGRLASALLLLVAAAGTILSLTAGTLEVQTLTAPIIQASCWIANLALFNGFYWHFNHDPQKNRPLHISGLIIQLSALGMALLLTWNFTGWAPMLIVVAAQAGAVTLSWRRKGWHASLTPFSVLGFLAATAWLVLRFSPSQFSAGYILLLLYAAAAGLGPLALVWRHGITKPSSGWLKSFPVAIVLVSLSIMIRQPAISFWFWPLLLGLELVGIFISLLMRAFIQVGLLVILILVGGLNWLFQLPAGMLGAGFFMFILAAGIILCLAVLLILRKSSQWTAALYSAQEPAGTVPAGRPDYEQWLASAPAAAVFVLLAASFLLPYPGYPHPGMTTLACFLALVLFAVRRLGFESPGVVSLLAATAAQAVLRFSSRHHFAGRTMRSCSGPGRSFQQPWPRRFYFSAPLKNGGGCGTPGHCSKPSRRSLSCMRAIDLWPEQGAQWAPLLLAILKLPTVALLLKRLEGRPGRNTILAFHGGALLFYVSTLPVLVLDHGWIGLTFVFEAAALLWLNRRIEHPGLRWTALVMAPAGLLNLVVSLPLLKHADSLPLLNGAVALGCGKFHCPGGVGSPGGISAPGIGTYPPAGLFQVADRGNRFFPCKPHGRRSVRCSRAPV